MSIVPEIFRLKDHGHGAAAEVLHDFVAIFDDRSDVEVGGQIARPGSLERCVWLRDSSGARFMRMPPLG